MGCIFCIVNGVVVFCEGSFLCVCMMVWFVFLIRKSVRFRKSFISRRMNFWCVINLLMVILYWCVIMLVICINWICVWVNLCF